MIPVSLCYVAWQRYLIHGLFILLKREQVWLSEAAFKCHMTVILTSKFMTLIEIFVKQVHQVIQPMQLASQS